MCKSKKNTNVVQPMNRNRNKNRNRSTQQPHRSSSSSSSAPPTSTNNNNYPSSSSSVPITESRSYIFNNNNNNNPKDWSNSSSISSFTSLSSLRHTLPENPHIYDVTEIAAATANFSSPHRLASSSWRCSLRGRDVVVFQRKFRRHMDIPELSHRLAIICRSHHSSLVKLLGASVSGNYIFLVYEFVAGASLSDCLRSRMNPSFTNLPTWISRMQIAADVAHGLDYVHNFSGSDSGPGFVHNHIKSSSIIVAEETLGAKICHFGTSDLCGEAVAAGNDVSGGKLRRSGSRMVRFEGTRGYMAPEFQLTGMATQKTDVYAFGVVVLELLSGDEAVRFEFDGGDDGGEGYRRVSVVDTARAAAEERGVGARKWVDKRLRDSFPVDVAEKMIRVGLECVGEDPNERPDMGQVAVEVSKLYLESQKWAEKMGTDIDLSVSLAPR